MAVADDDGVELFLPPLVDAARPVVLPQCLPPTVVGPAGLFVDAGNVFHGRVQEQKRIVAVKGEVVSNVILGDPVGDKGSLRKVAVREGHGNLGDVCAGVWGLALIR